MAELTRRFPGVENIAHRGASSLAPENTLLAAQAALEAGADMWEFDVRLSRDGVPVLFHDGDLKAKTDVLARFPAAASTAVGAFTLEELRQLDVGGWFARMDPFAQLGGMDAVRERFVGLPPTTLEEALDWTKAHRWRVNVELKETLAADGSLDTSLVEKTVVLLRRLGFGDEVLISSFCRPYLRLLQEQAPEFARGLLSTDPLPSPLEAVQSFDAQAYHLLWTQLKAEDIAPLREAGVQINVWTVDEVADMEALVAMGATGLITNFPQRLFLP